MNEIRKQNAEKLKGRRTKQKNMWLSDWTPTLQVNTQLDSEATHLSEGSISKQKLIPGITPISELDGDREEFDAEVRETRFRVWRYR